MKQSRFSASQWFQVTNKDADNIAVVIYSCSIKVSFCLLGDDRFGKGDNTDKAV